MSNVLSALGLLIAVVALAVSIVSARSAGRSARRSSDAAERSARAAKDSVAEQRCANDLFDAERAGRRVSWGEATPAGQGWRIVNTGNATAFEARLVRESGNVDQIDRPPRDVEPRDFLTFDGWIGGVAADYPVVRVYWRDAYGADYSEMRGV